MVEELFRKVRELGVQPAYSAVFHPRDAKVLFVRAREGPAFSFIGTIKPGDAGKLKALLEDAARRDPKLGVELMHKDTQVKLTFSGMSPEQQKLAVRLWHERPKPV